MDRVKVKICGITNLQDAIKASSLGVDALGFNFYIHSKRCIVPQVAKSIINNLPPFITTVGLFVNQSKQYINNILQEVKLNVLQFHGDESDIFCNNFAIPYIKGVRIHNNMNKQDISNTHINYPNSQAILFDSYQEDQYGGTGKSFNWQLLNQKLSFPWILSGGLTCLNIEEALLISNANIVDVASGVERDPRCKDPKKMQIFIEKINKFHYD